MRITKLTFREARIRNVDTSKSYTTTVGVFAVIFYFLIIVFFFYSSYNKGKIRLNNLTELRYPDKRILYTIMIIFTVLVTILLCDKGFFSLLDKRVVVPISLYGLIILIFLMTNVIPERFLFHNIISINGMILGMLILFFVNYSYSDYFQDSELTDVNNIMYATIGLNITTVLIGVYNIYNSYIRKTRLSPNWIPTIKNLLGFSEIFAFIAIGITFAIMISFPPLPDTEPQFTTF